ncbi:hypothetical protein STEG23_012720 [Scotinomys teguina]
MGDRLPPAGDRLPHHDSVLRPAPGRLAPRKSDTLRPLRRFCQVVVMYAFNPRTQKAEAGAARLCTPVSPKTPKGIPRSAPCWAQIKDGFSLAAAPKAAFAGDNRFDCVCPGNSFGACFATHFVDQVGLELTEIHLPLPPDLTDLCGQTWQGDALQLRSHSASRKFYFVTPDTDCVLWLRAAAPEDRLRFQFRFFLVYSLSSATRTTAATLAPNASSPDPCARGSYLQFYDGPQGASRALGPPTCGLTIPAPFISSGPWLGLRLVTRGRQPRVDFLGEVTSFRLGSCGPYFRCRNSRCVPRSLLCDDWDMDNCGDGSDQDSQPPASCRGPSRVPKQTLRMEEDSPKPLTLLVALGSAAISETLPCPAFHPTQY